MQIVRILVFGCIENERSHRFKTVSYIYSFEKCKVWLSLFVHSTPLSYLEADYRDLLNTKKCQKEENQELEGLKWYGNKYYRCLRDGAISSNILPSSA